jgi:hypothetical protein
MGTDNTSSADKQGNLSASNHPEYDEYLVDWKQMRDTFSGERVVKENGTVYLPKTAGMKADGTEGNDAYASYKLRTVFYDFVATTVADMLGVLEKEPTVYELPTRLEPLEEDAGPDSEPLKVVHRRVNEQQLITSRVGLLLDPPSATTPQALPSIVQYNAETILNWDSDNKEPRWIVLNESRNVVGEGSLTWVWKEEYRLLALDGSDRYYTTVYDKYPRDVDIDNPGAAVDSSDPMSGEAVYPMLNGNTLDTIPFVFINATSLGVNVEKPMLLGLSNLALAAYRGDADYRQALFLQAQDTLFLQGFTEEDKSSIRVGAGAFISSTNTEADAKFIGIESDGLPEMKESQRDLIEKATDMGIEMRDKSGVESGDAILTRLTVRTATLTTVAKVAAAGVQKLLRIAAIWAGVAPEEVEVTPNLDFTDSAVTPKEVLEMWTVTQAGGMTTEDFHAWLKGHDLTSDDLEEWQAKIADSTATALSLGLPG